MRDIVHPETLADFRSPVLDGRAVPTVDAILLERAIKDGMAPSRILTLWNLYEALWSGLALLGALLLLTEYWWAGLLFMTSVSFVDNRFAHRLNARLGNCAVVDLRFGSWAFSRGYLSLVMLAPQQQHAWASRIERMLDRAKVDARVPVAMSWAVLNIVSTLLIWIGKVVVGFLLLMNAVKNPGWVSIGVGGLIGAFYMLQSVVRTPFYLSIVSGIMSSRSRV